VSAGRPARGALAFGGRRAAAGEAADARQWRRRQRAGRRWAAWGAGLGALAGGLAFAPAQWLADAVGSVSNGRLLLAEARGSVWNGSAVAVLTGGEGSRDAAALPGRLAWTLRPAWDGLALAARHDCCITGTLGLHLAPGWGGWTLRLDGQPDPASALAHWPAAWLAGLGTPWNTLQLGGMLQLHSPGLTLRSVQGRLQLAGALALELRGASSRLSPLPTLGSYRLALQGQGTQGENAQLQLLTLDGALRLNGDGQWSGARLRFRGQAQAAAGQEAALANLLNIIGRRQGALSVISIG
jgi:general secretion pathway protein N